MTEPGDDLTAALEGYQERAEQFAARPGGTFPDPAKQDIRRLLAAVEAVLKEVRRMDVSGGGPIPMIHKKTAAANVREAITRELTGKDGTDG